MSQDESSTEQLTTFYIGPELFGIEVMRVQEVTGAQVIQKVPLSPPFVKGLINLRGQIATAIGLHELFGQERPVVEKQPMTVVCKLDGNLVSFLVDDIGDVVEVEKKDFEQVPGTLTDVQQKYIKGIYKMNGTLMSVLNLEVMTNEISPGKETRE